MGIVERGSLATGKEKKEVELPRGCSKMKRPRDMKLVYVTSRALY